MQKGSRQAPLSLSVVCDFSKGATGKSARAVLVAANSQWICGADDGAVSRAQCCACVAADHARMLRSNPVPTPLISAQAAKLPMIAVHPELSPALPRAITMSKYVSRYFSQELKSPMRLLNHKLRGKSRSFPVHVTPL
jgi:hypothetical protein